MTEKYFDLDYDMTRRIGEEFDPKIWVSRFMDSKEKADEFFSRYGEELMARSLELGEVNSDRSYEVLKAAIEKTGAMRFPLLPQRPIEIAYLSIQPFKRLWVLANTPKLFRYRIDECAIYQELQKYGELKELPCRSCCVSMLKKAFSAFGLESEVEMESEGGSCIFSVRNLGKV
jgi:hypothetical protein